jgi:UDP-glucose 4-epimerase
MKYLVTGGAGFIGSHLIDLLILKGDKVICIDDLSSGLISNITNFQEIVFINKKVQDVEFRELPEIDGIFHLAAQASVPISINDFYDSSANNMLCTFKVFDLARKNNIPVIYASSSAVYGNLPLGDDTKEIYDILSPYAQDKLSMEQYAQMAGNVFRTNSIGLRFFNVYGPRQNPHNPYSGVISIFIDRLLKGLPVTVNGGYQTRDFIFVEDIIKVLLKSMNTLHHRELCEAINVGTGKSITIDDLISELMKITRTNPEIIIAKLPPGDPERSEGTCQKLRNILGISSDEFKPVSQGLEETVKYYIKIRN